MAYATVGELEAGWCNLSAGERGRADVLLSRASSLLDERIIQAGADPVAIAMAKPEICKIIVCDAVRYSMDPSNGFGGGVFADTGQSYMPGERTGGGLQITDFHMRMLGIGKTMAGFFGHGR